MAYFVSTEAGAAWREDKRPIFKIEASKDKFETPPFPEALKALVLDWGSSSSDSASDKRYGNGKRLRLDASFGSGGKEQVLDYSKLSASQLKAVTAQKERDEQEALRDSVNSSDQVMEFMESVMRVWDASAATKGYRVSADKDGGEKKSLVSDVALAPMVKGFIVHSIDPSLEKVPLSKLVEHVVNRYDGMAYKVQAAEGDVSPLAAAHFQAIHPNNLIGGGAPMNNLAVRDWQTRQAYNIQHSGLPMQMYLGKPSGLENYQVWENALENLGGGPFSSPRLDTVKFFISTAGERIEDLAWMRAFFPSERREFMEPFTTSTLEFLTQPMDRYAPFSRARTMVHRTSRSQGSHHEYAIAAHNTLEYLNTKFGGLVLNSYPPRFVIAEQLTKIKLTATCVSGINRGAPHSWFADANSMTRNTLRTVAEMMDIFDRRTEGWNGIRKKRTLKGVETVIKQMYRERHRTSTNFGVFVDSDVMEWLAGDPKTWEFKHTGVPNRSGPWPASEYKLRGMEHSIVAIGGLMMGSRGPPDKDTQPLREYVTTGRFAYSLPTSGKEGKADYTTASRAIKMYLPKPDDQVVITLQAMFANSGLYGPNDVAERDLTNSKLEQPDEAYDFAKQAGVENAGNEPRMSKDASDLKATYAAIQRRDLTQFPDAFKRWRLTSYLGVKRFTRGGGRTIATLDNLLNQDWTTVGLTPAAWQSFGARVAQLPLNDKKDLVTQLLKTTDANRVNGAMTDRNQNDQAVWDAVLHGSSLETAAPICALLERDFPVPLNFIVASPHEIHEVSSAAGVIPGSSVLVDGHAVLTEEVEGHTGHWEVQYRKHLGVETRDPQGYALLPSVFVHRYITGGSDEFLPCTDYGKHIRNTPGSANSHGPSLYSIYVGPGSRLSSDGTPDLKCNWIPGELNRHLDLSGRFHDSYKVNDGPAYPGCEQYRDFWEFSRSLALDAILPTGAVVSPEVTRKGLINTLVSRTEMTFMSAGTEQRLPGKCVFGHQVYRDSARFRHGQTDYEPEHYRNPPSNLLGRGSTQLSTSS